MNTDTSAHVRPVAERREPGQIILTFSRGPAGGRGQCHLCGREPKTLWRHGNFLCTLNPLSGSFQCSSLNVDFYICCRGRKHLSQWRFMTTWQTPGRWSTLMHHGRQGGYCGGKRQVWLVHRDNYALVAGSIGWRVKVASATPQWSGTFPPRPAVAPTGFDTLDIPWRGSTGNQSSQRTKAPPTLSKWPLVITLPTTNSPMSS